MSTPQEQDTPNGQTSALVFCCSGAADVGEISHQAARQLDELGVANRFCLAGIGGLVDAHLRKTQTAKQILAIDGCKIGCASRTLQRAGFSAFLHLQVTDFGHRKGESPPTNKNVTSVTEAAMQLLKGTHQDAIVTNGGDKRID